ncbi:MAG TPA: hypothetical protein PKB09_02515 [Candidatus Saccharibacteria bacterium]|nr:hypothetical protein [Candidatus Saccharibacteria bacterium]
MAIIISENGKNAKKLESAGFGPEDNLQKFITDNPETVPVYDIREDIRLLILAREFPTNSGPIDALGVDQDGTIYIIETKLYKNPDKRLVIAQALDYGASMWRHVTDFDDFTHRLEGKVQQQFNMSLRDKLEDFFGIDDEAVSTLLQNVQDNLSAGKFKFVVLMDQLHDRLKDLIVFINQNSQFDVFAVELKYYKHEKYEITIPKLFGAEVKKDVVSTKSSSGKRRKWDEQSYWEEVANNLDAQKAKALRTFYDWSLAKADKVTWGTGASRGSFNPIFERISPISFCSVFTDGSVQISYGYLPAEEDIEIRKRLRDTLAKHVTVPEVTDVKDEALKSTYKSIPAEYVEKNVDKIIAALEEFTGKTL